MFLSAIQLSTFNLFLIKYLNVFIVLSKRYIKSINVLNIVFDIKTIGAINRFEISIKLIQNYSFLQFLVNTSFEVNINFQIEVAFNSRPVTTALTTINTDTSLKQIFNFQKKFKKVN